MRFCLLSNIKEDLSYNSLFSLGVKVLQGSDKGLWEKEELQIQTVLFYISFGSSGP